MNMILMTVALLGSISAENDLFHQKEKMEYQYCSPDGMKIIRLDLMRKKGLHGPRHQVMLRTELSVSPFRNQFFVHGWKGTYIVKRTRKELLIECHFQQRFETGIKGGLVKSPYFKPQTVTIHVDKTTLKKKKPEIQVYFTADHLKTLDFWKQHKTIKLN